MLALLEINLEILVKSRREAQTIIRVAKRNQEIRIAELTKVNPRKFFSYVNDRKPIKSKIGPLKDPQGVLHIDDRRLATIFNEYFVSVFTVEDISIIPEPSIRFEGVEENFLKTIYCTREDVEMGLNRLKRFKSPGPDKMVPFVLKRVKNSIIENLVKIFNYSIESRNVPTDWKSANVVPVYKKGDKTNAGNYRPISLTSVIGKLLESILTKHITNHLEMNNLIKDSQHGFRRHNLV